MKKTCGMCNYAFFKPIHCCLAPMAVGDKRRQKYIEKDTECFVPEYFSETGQSRKKRISLEELHKIQEQLNQVRKK